jgi:hypothetical protein
MMEVAAHVWRKKISSGLIRWLCLSFTSEIGPVLVITSKTITTQKPKNRNSKCRGYFIVRVVLDDACRVGIFPTFCRPFETR